MIRFPCLLETAMRSHLLRKRAALQRTMMALSSPPPPLTGIRGRAIGINEVPNPLCCLNMRLRATQHQHHPEGPQSHFRLTGGLQAKVDYRVDPNPKIPPAFTAIHSLLCCSPNEHYSWTRMPKLNA